LLHGQIEHALELFRVIPRGEGEEMSLTQLLGLVVSLVAASQEKEALKLMKDYPEFLEGLLSSIRTYANDLFSRDQRSMAISILRFVSLNFPNMVGFKDVVKRLFIMTRLHPNLIRKDKDLQAFFQSILKKEAKDDSSQPIPKFWTQLVKSNPDLPLQSVKGNPMEKFKGYYHILSLEHQEKDNQIAVIAWNEENQSTWQLLFPADYLPALEQSVKIKITSGKLIKILKRRQNDIFRGTLVFKEPSIQPELIQWWT
ncbi:MAG: hypothetical protein ACFFBD_01615, partial [Candidatus Hodarchaeota archaeon]